ncbi:collagen alpha-2(I) chain-like [Maniola jurtina]|uniref:collagen alpha-2(I) chain-like n=1 Tax=Maniola jurtina TaxID=191418 RepID=UPI001E68EA22|nr:collagen alpha-2(I) chain-like [Maniola jurtina]
MVFGTSQCALLLLVLQCSSGERWRWPDDAEGAASVRIDAKVAFVDGDQGGSRRNNRQNIQSDDIFQQPTDTEGFYNRPPGAGRYPPGRSDDRDIRINGRPAYDDGGYKNEKYQDGTLDALQYCKCVSTPDCELRTDYKNACGANQYLCCYKGKQNGQSEYFNEVDGERPMLFPGQSNKAGPFPPPNYENNVDFESGHGYDSQGQSGILVGPGGPTGIIGPQKKPVLVGPDGPTGVIGPDRPGVVFPERPVLVGPGGPTGVIGPNNDRPVLVGPGGPTGIRGPNNDRPILVGPGGPTGVFGPANNDRPVLVGPGGPTGIIGPANYDRDDNLLVRPLGSHNDVRQSESAQRGVLVGPGGPTGIIGPAFNLPYLFSSAFGGSGFNRPVLAGPGGPTGVIGPRLVGPGGPTGRIGPDFNRQSRGGGVLVGPGGPTGIIGPGRPILVGPGGPTGRIGPRSFGCMRRKHNQTKTSNGKLSTTKNRTQCVCSSSSQM